MSDKPIHVTDAEFEKAIKDHPYVVVDFWAEWCAPCRAIEPIVEDLAKRYAEKVTFVKVNTDENPMTPQRFMVMASRRFCSSRTGSSSTRSAARCPAGRSRNVSKSTSRDDR